MEELRDGEAHLWKVGYVSYVLEYQIVWWVCRFDINLSHHQCTLIVWTLFTLESRVDDDISCCWGWPSRRRERLRTGRGKPKELSVNLLSKYQSNNISRIISPLMISVKQKFLWSALSLKILIVECSVMEMIKHRKHSWISRPRRQVSVMLIGDSYWQMMIGNKIDCFWIFVLTWTRLTRRRATLLTQ